MPQPGDGAGGGKAASSSSSGGSGGSTSFGMWPALQPTPKLSSLLSATSPRADGLQGEDETTLPGEGTLDDWRHRGASIGEPSTQRVEQALSQAFDRLWRERPGGSESAAEAELADASVDGYISRYFRHVAELSRESVYQSHQRAVLCRIRDDVVAGDRSGNMRELEARIERVDESDRSLQAEIANLMRIAEPERTSCTGCRSALCCGGSGRGAGICCSPVTTSAAAAGPPQGQASGGKVIPGCQACTIQ
uniref:Uncharacterized protein n=1 Tax=Alexandrium monilatum TaxID=311494 RepID=A0A7S4UXU4_9DINO